MHRSALAASLAATSLAAALLAACVSDTADAPLATDEDPLTLINICDPTPSVSLFVPNVEGTSSVSEPSPVTSTCPWVVAVDIAGRTTGPDWVDIQMRIAPGYEPTSALACTSMRFTGSLRKPDGTLIREVVNQAGVWNGTSCALGLQYNRNFSVPSAA